MPQHPAPLASLGRRWGALLVDAALLLVAAFALSALGPGGGIIDGLLTGHLGVIAVLLGCPALLWVMMATRGTSPGKHLTGIRVIRSDNGDAPGWCRALGRLLMQGCLLVLTLGLAELSPLVDRTGRNRAWWDRAVGTEVVVGRIGESTQAVAYWRDAAVLGAGPAVPREAMPAPVWAPVPAAPPGTTATLYLRADAVHDVGAPGVGGASASDRTVITGRPPEAPSLAIRLQFDSRETHSVHGSALVGRDPAGTDAEADCELIALFDATRSVSKTHVKIERDAEGLWITDRHSTNGVEIRLSDGGRMQCEPGARTRLPADAVVGLGERTVRCRAVDAGSPGG